LIRLAPEVLEEKPYGIKADIYSLGVLLYYMVFANFPYTHPSNDNKELAKEISKKPLRVDYPGIEKF
jgi:serine/threonine protein kinase